ncbi:MAG: HEAT repeat domain-containing protein [Lachnospiraceae bacterium]|nr:HEAT repeat domain-containing protein [Lachnospiraceae bacterium]
MNETELYKELGILTKDKSKWKENLPYVLSLLDHESVKIQAKALWLIGEMGLEYPDSIQTGVPEVASFCDSEDALLRERAVNALGRIGRGNYSLIEQYWKDLFRFACDNEPKVRLSFIWASENIATNTPDIYKDHMPVFESLLHDIDDKVRMESPEIFRVIGKRRPELVIPYIEQLQKMAETDSNRVVRIHSLGAIKATNGFKAKEV